MPSVVGLAYVRDGSSGRWVLAARTLVLLRAAEGWVTGGRGFREEIDVSEDLVRRVTLPCVRLERGRLYVSAANGEAVYVPLGPAAPSVPREAGPPGRVRYGRLYLRRSA